MNILWTEIMMKISFSGELRFREDSVQYYEANLFARYKPAGHGNGPVEGVKDGFEGLMVSFSILNPCDSS